MALNFFLPLSSSTLGKERLSYWMRVRETAWTSLAGVGAFSFVPVPYGMSLQARPVIQGPVPIPTHLLSGLSRGMQVQASLGRLGGSLQTLCMVHTQVETRQNPHWAPPGFRTKLSPPPHLTRQVPTPLPRTEELHFSLALALDVERVAS